MKQKKGKAQADACARLGKIILFILILLTIGIGCENNEPYYDEMVEVILSDSTLADSLFFYLARDYYSELDSYNEVKQSRYNYNIYNILNSGVFDQYQSLCIEENDKSELIINTIEMNRDVIEPKIDMLENSDSARVHIYFTQRMDNIQGAFAFYRDHENYSLSLLAIDPLFPIWRHNSGLFYLFQMTKSGDIELICKEMLSYE